MLTQNQPALHIAGAPPHAKTFKVDFYSVLRRLLVQMLKAKAK
jgi:hypothetical protein